MTSPPASAAPAVSAPSQQPWLAHVPVPLFASVMGLAGLSLAWRKAHETVGAPLLVAELLLALGVVVFIGMALLYGAKALRHPQSARHEFDHPIRANFFPTISISLLLLAMGLHANFPVLAQGMWLVAAPLHLMLTVRVVARWIRHKHDLAHINPAWFIPVVGNIIVPILGMKLGYAELSSFYFSVGLTFWLVLLTIVLYRVIFHDDLPPKLLPTLFILVAPPAVGFLSWLALNGGHLDMLARLLVHVAIFTLLVLAALWRSFRGLPFAPSWWAYTFPLDAAAIALLQYAHMVPGPLVWGAQVVLGLTTLVVGAVFVRTLRAIAAGEMFVPE